MNLNETELLLLKLLFFDKKKKMIMITLDVSTIEINASDQCDF